MLIHKSDFQDFSKLSDTFAYTSINNSASCFTVTSLFEPFPLTNLSGFPCKRLLLKQARTLGTISQAIDSRNQVRSWTNLIERSENGKFKAILSTFDIY